MGSLKAAHTRLLAGAVAGTVLVSLLLTAAHHSRPGWSHSDRPSSQLGVEGSYGGEQHIVPAVIGIGIDADPELETETEEEALRPPHLSATAADWPTPNGDTDSEEVRHHQAVLDLRDISIGRLHMLNQEWNAKRELEEGRYQLRSLDLDEYDSEMRYFWHSLMSSEYDRAVGSMPPLSPIIETVLSRISVSSPPVAASTGVSKKIWSSSPSSWIERPQFDHWRGRNPGFEVRNLDDAAVARWIEKTFGDARIVAEFKALPKNILKSDTFRYLVVLLEGGAWGDADTSPVKGVLDWGAGWTDETDPRMQRQETRRHNLWAQPSSRSRHSLPSEDPPALIISPEQFSKVSQHRNPKPWWVRNSFARRVQIVQWSFAAAPGHPVLLDAVGRILERGRKLRDGAPEVTATLEWTGPGLFTDCVFRYLKARWGFDFYTLESFDHPIRVGDVLILPRNALQAPNSAENQDEVDKLDAKHVVWHAFAGSWKGSQND